METSLLLVSSPQLTFWHWAGLSPYTLACAFAQTCVFVKQSPHNLYLRPIYAPSAWESMSVNPKFKISNYKQYVLFVLDLLFGALNFYVLVTRQVRHLPKLRLANLPSSLRKVLSLTLAYSASSPVSVCGTDLEHSHCEGFLGL